LVAIGRVRRPHGVRGELSVEPYAADVARYESLGRVFVDGIERRVRGVRVHGDAVLLTLEGVDGREAADALRNMEICVPAAERAPLPPERFYIDDLIGLRVVDTKGRARGVVQSVLERPGADLLQVRTPSGGEGLVPMVRAIVKQVDVAAGEILIDPPEGLLPDPDGDGGGAR
jgi:16S rRNA processing protein RimM